MAKRGARNEVNYGCFGLKPSHTFREPHDEAQDTLSRSRSTSALSVFGSLRPIVVSLDNLWRYDNHGERMSTYHLKSQHGQSGESVCSRTVPKRRKRRDFQKKPSAPSTSLNVAQSADQSDVVTQRSLPLFEVLPQMASSSKTKTELLYQNSYVLDGVKYDFHPGRSKKGGGKLKLNFFRFLKSMNSSNKPRDDEIIFGDANVLLSEENGWERSRIQWLHDLEHTQELRRKRIEERQHSGSKGDCEGVDFCCLPCMKGTLVWYTD